VFSAAQTLAVGLIPYSAFKIAAHHGPTNHRNC